MIFLGIRAVKYARKSYKKHQAEKEMNLRSNRPAIVDPSNELQATSGRNSQDSYGSVHRDSYQTLQSQYELRAPSPQKSRRNSDSSFMSQTSLAEFETELENDPEFRRFIEEQQRLYQSFQQQSRRSSRPVSNVTPSTYTNNVQPPTYDSVMAQSGPDNVRPHSHSVAEPNGFPIQDGRPWSRMAARVANHTP